MKLTVESLRAHVARHGIVWSESTARRTAKVWFEQQGKAVPRVTLEGTGGKGRPGYRVDAASLDAWVRRQHPIAHNCNSVANDG